MASLSPLGSVPLTDVTLILSSDTLLGWCNFLGKKRVIWNPDQLLTLLHLPPACFRPRKYYRLLYSLPPTVLDACDRPV